MHNSDRENLLSIFYGSLLILSVELIFLKLTPNIYPIINTIPLLFLSQIIALKLFLLSLMLSFIFFVLLFLTDFLNSVISQKVLLNFFTISTIVFFFTFLLNEKKKKKFRNEKIIVYLTFFSLLISGLLFYFFFSEIEQNQLREYLLKFVEDFLKDQGTSDTIDPLPLIETIIYIMPSINVFLFLITFLINFNVTRLLIGKLNFLNRYNFEVLIFLIPIIIFFLFNFLFILSTQTNENIHFFFLNCTIVLSFLIFFEGFILLFKFFKQLKLNSYLKILIIFLLFIFLGYVLFILFLLGFFMNLKKITKRIINF